MFKNYFTVAIRNLLKNKVSSFINIAGLTVGLAIGIIILLVIVNEFSFDKYNKNLADIYLLMKNQNMNGEVITGRNTPGLLATSIRSEIPEVKYAVRTSQQSDMVNSGNKTIYSNNLYTDADFFNIMSLQALAGNPIDVMKHPDQVVITETAARKIFNTTDVVNKTLLLNSKNALKIGAVIKDVPQNSSITFDMAIPFMLFESENDWLKKWDDNRIQTWVQLKPNVNLGVVNEKLKALFLSKQDEKNVELFAFPLKDLRLYGQFKNGKSAGGTIDLIVLLAVIAGFVLLVACVNFMNLATAQSEIRAREVGVRKVLGASRSRIMFQFLSEALLLSLIALFIGMLLASEVLPIFMRLTSNYFTPDYTNPRLWVLLITLALLTGLLAGSYPAFYLSRFKPVNVLKNLRNSSSGGGLLRKALVTFQFVVSIFLMITTVVIAKQVEHLKQRPLGYAADNLIDIPANNETKGKFDVLKNDLLQIPGVQSVSAGTDNPVRISGAFNGLEWPGKTPDKDFYINATWVQHDWVKTVGFHLVEGRDFSADFGADSSACLINEAAAKRMGLKEPIIGIKLGGNTVIGIIRDFVYNHPFSNPEPMIVYLRNGNMNHFLVRIANNESWKACISRIEAAVRKVSPDFPFEFEFTSEEYQRNFKEFDSLQYVATVFGGMAILISCLGLFGLSAFIAERRGKEISIRKILGAGLGSIWFTLSKDFLKPVFIAFAIAAPLAAIILQKALALMDYHIALSGWMFALPILGATAIALITVSYNGLKTAFANPVKSLRSE